MKRFQLLFIKLLPYLVGSGLIFALMFFGSQVETSKNNDPIAKSFGTQNFRVTADQVSETYTVASIANTLELPSAPTMTENFVTVSNHYEETGTLVGSTVDAKPNVIDTSSVTRGVDTYEVKDGDTLDTIADTYGVTKDHIRWSNNLKNEEIVVGSKLLIPSVDGIVYKVKEGDSIDSLAEKYGAKKEEIIAYNDLEKGGLAIDTQIILPGGTLPEKERPEYVAPVVVAIRPTQTYWASGSGGRNNLSEVGSYGYWNKVYYDRSDQGSAGNPGAFGNCTWFAWYWRNHNVQTGALPGNYRLPGGAIGNARDWAYSLGSRGYAVNRTPAFGAIFQSMGGYYGHVGVVVGVDPGKSITIQEMNYAGPNGMLNHVYQSELSWADAMNFNYIHGR